MDKLKERIEAMEERANESYESWKLQENFVLAGYYEGKASAYADILLMIKSEEEGL